MSLGSSLPRFGDGAHGCHLSMDMLSNELKASSVSPRWGSRKGSALEGDGSMQHMESETFQGGFGPSGTQRRVLRVGDASGSYRNDCCHPQRECGVRRGEAWHPCMRNSNSVRGAAGGVTEEGRWDGRKGSQPGRALGVTGERKQIRKPKSFPTRSKWPARF